MRRPKSKRSLSHLGGKTRAWGHEETLWTAPAWREALREDPDGLTHGFHSWPGRMHWALARSTFSAYPGRSVVDPFCGGGTVLVEAMIAGRRSIGLDLSPLAQMVASVRTEIRRRAEREAFVSLATDVAERSFTRVRERVDIRVDLPRTELRWYAPHVLKELGGLKAEIETVRAERDRIALLAVFSSILIKASQQRSETAPKEAGRKIRKGLATEFFVRKAKELSTRWEELAHAAANAPTPRVFLGDARRLAERISVGVDLILTSPPYAGTYDYADHHARRNAWFRLDDQALRESEMGARRFRRHADAFERWERDLGVALKAMAQVLRTDGRIVMVIGDGRYGRRAIDAVAQLKRLGPRTGLKLLGGASQERTDGRSEHLVVLSRHRV